MVAAPNVATNLQTIIRAAASFATQLTGNVSTVTVKKIRRLAAKPSQVHQHSEKPSHVYVYAKRESPAKLVLDVPGADRVGARWANK